MTLNFALTKSDITSFGLLFISSLFYVAKTIHKTVKVQNSSSGYKTTASSQTLKETKVPSFFSLFLKTVNSKFNARSYSWFVFIITFCCMLASSFRIKQVESKELFFMFYAAPLTVAIAAVMLYFTTERKKKTSGATIVMQIFPFIFSLLEILFIYSLPQ